MNWMNGMEWSAYQNTAIVNGETNTQRSAALEQRPIEKIATNRHCPTRYRGLVCCYYITILLFTQFACNLINFQLLLICCVFPWRNVKFHWLIAKNINKNQLIKVSEWRRRRRPNNIVIWIYATRKKIYRNSFDSNDMCIGWHVLVLILPVQLFNVQCSCFTVSVLWVRS